MNKKHFIVIVVLLLVVTSLVWYFISQSKPESNQGTPIAAMNIEQALALRHTSTCISNDASTKATVQSLPGLSEDSGIYTQQIYDVPAGTKVSVSIGAYDSPSNTFAGSLAYPSQYGSYNFQLQKQSDVWRYVAFIRCG